MSLKAKLEAVIYAAEEPVTLAQLAALFSTDALEWKSGQAAANIVVPDSAETGEDATALLNAEVDSVETEQPSEAPASPIADAGDAGLACPEIPDPEIPDPEIADPASAETFAEVQKEPVSDCSPEEAAARPADAEGDQKQLARARDREVRAILRGLLDELIANYASDDRGIEIKEIAGGYRMATKPECHDAARLFVKSLKPTMKLSLPALETLAVIAYKQPVTAPEVNEIRGVDSSGVFGSLLARKLIATAGRKQVIGRPILYKTTKEFLLRFGLKDVSELPSMDEFEKIAQLEFEDMEPLPEEEASSAVSDESIVEATYLESEEIDGDRKQEAEAGEKEIAEGAKKKRNETAAMAGSDELPDAEQPDQAESFAGLPVMEAETTPAEAAPAAPSPLEQAETETVPHD